MAIRGRLVTDLVHFIACLALILKDIEQVSFDTSFAHITCH